MTQYEVISYEYESLINSREYAGNRMVQVSLQLRVTIFGILADQGGGMPLYNVNTGHSPFLGGRNYRLSEEVFSFKKLGICLPQNGSLKKETGSILMEFRAGSICEEKFL